MAYISKITPLGSSESYDIRATALGSSTVGSSNTAIYLNNGTPTACYTPVSGNFFRGIPQVGSDGVMEIGKYIDFHSTNAATTDYDVRLTATTQLTSSATIEATGLLKTTNNSNTTTIGSQNANFCHIYNSVNIPFIFNNSVLTTGGNLGDSTYPFDNLTLGRSNGAGIYYKGTQNTYRMIRFIDNTSDVYGNGISIGGGGQTIIGGGESADTAAAQAGTAGAEIMQVCNDGDVQIISNLQNGWDNRKVLTLNTSGYLMCPSYINVPTSNNENPTLSQFIVTNGSDHYYRKASAAHAMAAIRSNASGSWGINITGNAATASNADKLDNLDSLDFLRNFHTNAAVGNIDTFNTTNYFYAHGDEGGFASGTNPGGHNGTAILNAHTHSGNYYTQLGLDTARNALWIRSANNSSTFGNWLRVVTNSGTWGISITGNAATASQSKAVIFGSTIGSSSTTHATALQNWFNSNKASTPRNQLIAFYDASSGNGSLTFGYFLSDYDSNPYGGFYCAHYNTPYYIGIQNGTYTQSQIWKKGDAVTGAVWNDYAEYREATPDSTTPGYVVFENGDDTLSLTTERLQHFAGITSDTWGFAQGETEKAKTPIAVSGRVLAYTYRDRNEYKPGDCVCAAPGGTIDIMTREEIREWPDRIVGTVSCVPEYDEWGGGELADRLPVKVNGRIWIKVR